MIEELNTYWETEYPGTTPIPYRFKELYSERWVRFHSLPESKRYPDNEAELQIILERHNTLIDEISGTTAVLFLLTTGYTQTPAPHTIYEDLQELDPTAQYWRTIVMHESDDEPDDYRYWHIYASKWNWKKSVLDPIFRLIAQDTISNVTLISTEKQWIYHPYDGGTDVILNSVIEKEELMNRHRDWLSQHPSGM